MRLHGPWPATNWRELRRFFAEISVPTPRSCSPRRANPRELGPRWGQPGSSAQSDFRNHRCDSQNYCGLQKQSADINTCPRKVGVRPQRRSWHGYSVCVARKNLVPGSPHGQQQQSYNRYAYRYSKVDLVDSHEYSRHDLLVFPPKTRTKGIARAINADTW